MKVPLLFVTQISKRMLLGLLVFLVVFGMSLSVLAAPNPEINYQGKLTTATNVAVANGTYLMQFNLYTASSSGVAIWTETRSGVNRVTVTNGLFSVMLGSVTSLSGVNFNQTLYLGVTIEADAEMSPRKILGTVPAAFEANNAATVGGVASTSLVRNDQANTVTASTSASLFSIIQNGTGDIFNLFDGGTKVFTVLDGGNVGIGTSTPDARLHILGTNQQLRTGYDTTNYLSITTGPTGTTTFNATGTSPAIQFTDSQFELADDSDSTKRMGFQLSGITTGTKSLWTFPAGTATFVGTSLTQTLSNKTISAGTFTGASLFTGTSTFATTTVASSTITDLSLINALALTSGGTGATTASGARTNLGATTVGANIFTLPNPSALTFLRINADNTVSAVATSTLGIALSDTTGILAATRGGTGLSTITQNQLLIGGAGNTWSQVATSSLGLSAAFTTSADLAAIISNETGSGALVFGTSPTFGGTVVFPSQIQMSGTFFTRSGNHNLTLTSTATTNVTLPSSGTLYGTAASSITSANLLLSISDKTGTGTIVFSESPLFTGTAGFVNVTATGTLAISGTSTLATTTIASSTITTLNLVNALALTSGGTGATTASGARTNLGATTVGANIFTLPNPSALTFLRINADNTVSAVATSTLGIALSDTTGILAATRGGTGLASYTTGDLIYASGANTLSNRTIGTTGDVLSVVAGVPTWVATSTLGLSGGSSLFTDGGATTYLTSLTDNLSVGSTSAASKLDVYGNFQVGTSSLPNLFVNAASNFVGISTTTKLGTAALVIDGTTALLGNSINNDGTAAKGLDFDSANRGYFRGLSGTEYSLNILNTSNSNNSKAVLNLYHSSTVAYSSVESNFMTGNHTDISFVTSLAGAETEKMRIMSTGNVGIGTTTPNSKLSVTGDGFFGGSVTATGTLAISGTSTLATTTIASSTITTLNLVNALALTSGGTGATTASGARTNLGATTVGANIFTLPNPSALTFLRINADNTVSAVATSTLGIALSDTTGILAATRGGTGLSTITENQLLIGGAGNTWSQVATSSLGLSASFTNSAQLAALLSDETGTGLSVFSVSPTFNGTAIFTNISATGTLAISGTSTLATTSIAGLVQMGTTSIASRFNLDVGNFSTAGTAGINRYYTSTNAASGTVQFGELGYVRIGATATTTMVGSMFRVEDSTTFANTIRGFEVQTNRGSNTRGENTALSGFARTFGVRGFTSADAGGVFEPAGGYFETGGTTQGNAIRGYSSTITTANLASLFQDTSAFTGNGLIMNLGNGTGSFTGKFMDLQVAGASKFNVASTGTLFTLGDISITATNTDPADNNVVGIYLGASGFASINRAANPAMSLGRTTDGAVLEFYSAGTVQGSVSIAGATVSYNAFTGSHFGLTGSSTYPMGTLLTLTGENQSYNDIAASEILYGMTQSREENSPLVIGSYLSVLEPTVPESAANPTLVMAVGNGAMWVADQGEDISRGDYLISSNVAGHAERDPQTAEVSNIIARASEDINWDTVTEEINGVKHKRITVFFETFTRTNINLALIASSTIELAEIDADSVTGNFMTGLLGKLTEWFSNAQNGIGDMYANVFNANERICVDGECLTADDIRNLKDAIGAPATPTPPTPPSNGSGSSGGEGGETDTGSGTGSAEPPPEPPAESSGGNEVTPPPVETPPEPTPPPPEPTTPPEPPTETTP